MDSPLQTPRRGPLTPVFSTMSLNAEPKMHQRHAEVHQLETNKPSRRVWLHFVLLASAHLTPWLKIPHNTLEPHEELDTRLVLRHHFVSLFLEFKGAGVCTDIANVRWVSYICIEVFNIKNQSCSCLCLCVMTQHQFNYCFTLTVNCCFIYRLGSLVFVFQTLNYFSSISK